MPAEHDPIKPTIHFLYRPKSITALCLMLAFLVWAAVLRKQPTLESLTATGTTSLFIYNAKFGLAAVVLVFLFMSMLLFGNGPFIRPHPLVWRLVLGMSVLYQLALVFMAFQDKHSARTLFGWLDSTLGKRLPERSYAENCQMCWSNVSKQMDAFVIAHTLGWYVKALLFRDTWLCWLLSVAFELAEYALEHQLPNFAECWWDHWLLDVAICNALGIWAGMWTCRYLQMKTYCWRGIRELPSLGAKVRRTLAQFTPHSWKAFEWQAGASLRNYILVVVVCVLVLICELNAFYLKYLLWIPPEHPINTIRLVLMALFAAPALRELYRYGREEHQAWSQKAKLGAHAWLMIANVLTEAIICVKWSQCEFTDKVAPFWVKCMCSGIASLVIGCPLIKFWLFKKPVREEPSIDREVSGDEDRHARRHHHHHYNRDGHSRSRSRSLSKSARMTNRLKYKGQ